MDTALNIASLIITIILGVAGILVSIFCWKHTYKKLTDFDKLIKKLTKIDLNKETAFSEITDLIIEYDKNHNDSTKMSKKELMTALYSMYQNNRDKTQNENETDPRNKTKNN